MRPDSSGESFGSPCEHIRASHFGSVLTIELLRPEKHNALSKEMICAITQLLNEAELDESIGAVIIGGSDKVFSAGTDVATFIDAQTQGHNFAAYRKRVLQAEFPTLIRRCCTFSKPLIAAVEGYCFGGGLELALFADIIVAGEAARFSFPEASLGLIPGAGGTQTLPRRTSPSFAKDMMFTGRRVAASEAKQVGLIDYLVPNGEARSKASEIAAATVKNAPLAIMMIKQAIDRGLSGSFVEGLGIERDLSSMLAFSEIAQRACAHSQNEERPNF